MRSFRANANIMYDIAKLKREIVLGCIPMHVERDLAVSIATICSDHTAVARLLNMEVK